MSGVTRRVVLATVAVLAIALGLLPMSATAAPEGVTIGERVKKNAAELAADYGFEYGGVFRRLIARR